MILINVKLTAKPGQMDALKTMLMDVMAASQAEEGCIEYRFTQGIEQEDEFYLLELWQDEAALKNHFKGAGFKSFIAQIPELGSMNSSVAQQGEFSPYEIPR